MSKTREEIIKQLKELQAKSFVNVPGKIVSVDEDKKSCVVLIDKIEYEDIRLNAVIDDDNDKHSFIVPVVDSWVVVSFVSGSDTDAFLSAFSEIDKVIIEANEIVFNKGELKGLPKIESLKEKLNNIENDINSLKQAFTSWIPVPNDGGAALKSGIASWAAQQLTQTQLTDIENEKIKQ